MATTTASDIKDDLKALERVRPRSYFMRLVSLCGIGTFFNSFDTLMIGSVIPALIVFLHMGFAQVGDIGAAALIGSFVGALTFGIISERLGRKTAFVIAIIEYSAFGIITGLMSSFYSIYILRLLSGFGLGGEVLIAATLISEWAPTRRRGLIILGYESTYAWATFLTPLIAAGIYAVFGMGIGWRILFFLLAIPLAAGIASIYALWESPRWLLNKGRVQEARAIINKAEKRARSEKVEAEIAEVDKEIDNADTTPKGTELRELFSKKYRRRTGFNWTMWFTAYTVGIGMLVWLPEEFVSVGHEPASISLLMTGIIGAISVVVVYFNVFLVDRIGRKPMALIGYSLGLVGLIFGMVEAVIYHNLEWPVLLVANGFAFCGMGAILSLLLFTYTSELFPTRMRSWALGVGSAVCWVASIITVETIGLVLAAGPTTYLGMFHVFLIFFIAGVVGLIVTAIFGIETKQKLLETLSP